MSRLREPFASLAADLAATLMTNGMPESRSDMEWGLEAILRKYELRLRAVPLDREEVRVPPSTCPVCRKPNDGAVKHIGRDSAGAEIHCHMDCIFFKGEVGTKI